MKYAIIALTAVLLLSVAFNIYYSCSDNGKDNKTARVDTLSTTDTLVRRDTIEKTRWIPCQVQVIRRDTVTKDTVLTFETKEYRDTLASSQDTLFLKASISGINPKLDSVKYDWRHSVITHTVEITKYAERKKTWRDRISIGPSVTVGYDPLNKQWGMAVGVGLSLDLW